MELLHARAKKWGNSVGVRLPKRLGIGPEDELVLKVTRVKKKGTLRNGWGLFRKKADTQAILDEVNEEIG